MEEIERLAADVAGLRARVESAESVLAIHALKAEYSQLVDRRFVRGQLLGEGALSALVARAADLFTEDATWDGGPGLGVAVGRAAIADRLAATTLSFGRHYFVSPRIEVDGDRAHGRWELLSPCRRPDGTSYWMAGYEDDEYRRVDGRWLHASMRLTAVFMTPVGEGWTTILA